MKIVVLEYYWRKVSFHCHQLSNLTSAVRLKLPTRLNKYVTHAEVKMSYSIKKTTL